MTTSAATAWTAHEDALLLAAVTTVQSERGPAERMEWAKVADRMNNGRSKEQCLQRYTMSLQPGIKKGYWTDTEDKQLTAAVERAVADAIADGAPFVSRAAALKRVSWPSIATAVAGRSSKKCKERWQRHLTPDLNRAPWAAAEDAVLLQLHSELGSKWVAIAARLDRRSPAKVRNRTQALLRTQHRVKPGKKRAAPAQQPVDSKRKRARAGESPTSAAAVCFSVDFELGSELDLVDRISRDLKQLDENGDLLPKVGGSGETMDTNLDLDLRLECILQEFAEQEQEQEDAELDALLGGF